MNYSIKLTLTRDGEPAISKDQIKVREYQTRDGQVHKETFVYITMYEKSVPDNFGNTHNVVCGRRDDVHPNYVGQARPKEQQQVNERSPQSSDHDGINDIF